MSPAFRGNLPDGAASYDAVSVGELARRLGVPAVMAYDTIGSTFDAAHLLAEEGVVAGTLILADEQTAGRGRMGRVWQSNPGAGIWLTLIERPRDVAALEVLSLRVGLALAPVLDAFAADAVRLKWPNDLYVGGKKVGGILAEARWREGMPEWVAIGIGINVRAPVEQSSATGLRAGTSRIAVLDAALPALRRAASLTGLLDAAELQAFAIRDLAVGRQCVEPLRGTVCGIDASGALLIDIGSGAVAIRSGSLVLTEET